MEVTVEQVNGKSEDTISSSLLGGAESHSATAFPTYVVSHSPRTVTANLTVRTAPQVDVAEKHQGKARNLFVVWLIATLRLVYSSLRHPGHPVWIDRRTGDVWLKHD